MKEDCHIGTFASAAKGVFKREYTTEMTRSNIKKNLSQINTLIHKL